MPLIIFLGIAVVVCKMVALDKAIFSRSTRGVSKQVFFLFYGFQNEKKGGGGGVSCITSNFKIETSLVSGVDAINFFLFFNFC